MPFTKLHSVYGRMLGISSTRGIVAATNSSGAASTAFVMAAQMWGDAMVQTVSSGGASIINSGVTIVSTDSTSGMAALVLSPPVAGLSKEIIFQGSATALSLDTSATTILFQTSGSSLTGILGTTTISLDGDANRLQIGGHTLTLRGLSGTVWAVLGGMESSRVSS